MWVTVDHSLRMIDVCSLIQKHLNQIFPPWDRDYTLT